MANSVPNVYNESLECAICFDPLFIEVDDEETGLASTIPDDVLLNCRRSMNLSGHHYHWACLQELDESGQWDRSACPFPTCGGSPVDEQGKLLVTIRNEGGVTENFDLGAAFDEEREEPLTRKQELCVFLILLPWRSTCTHVSLLGQCWKLLMQGIGRQLRACFPKV